MSGDIKGMRERLAGTAGALEILQETQRAADLRYLLADHARLQGKNAELAGAVRGLLDALPSSTSHPAIAAARKAVQP